jgi:hypothetical protein
LSGCGLSIPPLCSTSASLSLPRRLQNPTLQQLTMQPISDQNHTHFTHPSLSEQYTQ